MIIPMGEWLPDLPPLNNPGILKAFNVIPGKTAYEPVPSMLKVASASAIGKISGSYYARDSANNTYTYAGDQSALYVQSGVTFNVATRTAGGAYNTDIADSWEFVSWAQTVIAVNGLNDLPQQISLGAANFVNLTGAPKARHIAVIKDFVVLGNVSDSAAQVQRVRWCAINNSASWTPDPATLADFQDLPGNGGWVQKVISGEQGFIFQERAIWRMTFVGSPLIFQFDKIHDGIGAYAPGSVCNYENLVYFLAADGFKSFDGTNLVGIGAGKVDKTFFADLDTNFIGHIKGVIFPDMKVVFWSYPGAGNNIGESNHILVYSMAYNKWARIDIPDAFSGGVDQIVIASTVGYTLDGLDAVSTNLDTLPFSLDSRVWTGGTLAFAAFINQGLYYFNAVPMDTEVETGEVDLMLMSTGVVMHKAQVNEVWPLVEGLDANVKIQIAARDLLTKAPNMTGDLVVESAGFAQAHSTARFHRFTVKTTGDFDQIQGVDVIAEDAGKR